MSTIDGRLREPDLPDVAPVVDGYVPVFAPFVRSGDQIQLSESQSCLSWSMVRRTSQNRTALRTGHLSCLSK